MPLNHFQPQGFTPGPIQGGVPTDAFKSAYSIKCYMNAAVYLNNSSPV